MYYIGIGLKVVDYGFFLFPASFVSNFQVLRMKHNYGVGWVIHIESFVKHTISQSTKR